MNIFKGIIESVDTEGNLSVVRVQADNLQVTAIVVDTVVSAPFLIPGNDINVHFKELEVVLARNFSGQISFQNQWTGTITEIELGKLLASVTLKCGNNSITSIITNRAATDMNLRPGDTVTAMVKTNEISLSPL